MALTPFALSTKRELRGAARGVAQRIEAEAPGWVCVSSWLESEDRPLNGEKMRARAQSSMEEIRTADALVVLHCVTFKGTYWADLGIALALGKRVLVLSDWVAPPYADMAYHVHLEAVEVYGALPELIAGMRG